MTYSAEVFNLSKILLQDIWLCSLMKAVKLWDVVDLNVVVDAINESGHVSFSLLITHEVRLVGPTLSTQPGDIHCSPHSPNPSPCET